MPKLCLITVVHIHSFYKSNMNIMLIIIIIVPYMYYCTSELQLRINNVDCPLRRLNLGNKPPAALSAQAIKNVIIWGAALI